MLSDEEKKAINNLNFIIVTDIYDNEVSIDKTKIINEYNESVGIVLNLIRKQSKEIEELKKDKLELINKNHVVHLKDVEKELREMRKEIDTKNAEIECLNVIHESYKENIVKIYNREGIISEKEKEITKLKNEIYDLKKKIYAINLLSNSEEE